MIRTLVSALSLMLICVSQNANAQIFSQDLTMHVSTTSSGMAGRGGGTFNSTEYFSKNAMKMTASEDDDFYAVVRYGMWNEGIAHVKVRVKRVRPSHPK